MKKFIIFILGIFIFVGCNSNTDIGKNHKQIKPSNITEDKIITITVRNASYPMEDPGGNNLSTHYKLRERQIDLPLNQIALILIDTWDIENRRFQNSSRIDIAKKIKPILSIARELDMTVLHVPDRPIGWDGINHKTRDIDLRGPTDSPRSEIPKWVNTETISKNQWPPIRFIFRVGKYAKYSKYNNPLYIPYTKILGIHKELLPQKRDREFIESRLHKIQEIFRDNQILHLLYVGEATNQCIMQRPAGIRSMSALGYNTIIVRNATVGSELSNTCRSQRVTKAAILDIEINNGFSISSDDLLKALRLLKNKI